VELQIGNNRPDIDTAEGRLLALMEANGFGDAARFAVRLAFEEAVINAFRHGHKGMPPETTVTIAIAVDPEQVRIAVTDQGPGFDPDAVPDCTLDENLEKTSGRGLMLIRSFMSDVRHEAGGRRLVMTYRKDAAADGEAA
ncbi:MAG TPA: ATP-binding protein, partial [Phycisphaerales bacterium]|nr:ATP-binding protein [Phycisphaerales bacterium]